MHEIRQSDSDLMRRFREGDQTAFEAIVLRYRVALVRALLRIARSHENAEDLAQEAFLKLYRAPEKYRDGTSLAAYLFTLGFHHAVDELRRRQTWSKLAPLLAMELDEYRGERSPEQVALSQERERQVRVALDHLRGTIRLVFDLHHGHGWSVEDIATATASTPGAVRTCLCRARDQLRRELGPLWKGKEHDGQRNRCATLQHAAQTPGPGEGRTPRRGEARRP